MASREASWRGRSSVGAAVGGNRLIVAGLLVLMIGLVGRSSPRRQATAGDPAARIDADGSLPASIRSTLSRACFDCHSDETRWPWYSGLPLASWLIERDVREARGQLNFSRWTEYHRIDRADLLDKACELATAGDMPLWQYRLLHPEARLANSDIAALCDWTRSEAARLMEAGS